MATTSELEQELFEPPDDVWHLLTDAHCHPTDDPRPWGRIDVLSGKLKDVKIGRICAMSTSSADQDYVSQLANKLPQRIVPAFGYHPWFSHKIAVEDASTGLVPPAESHYRNVLGKDDRSIDELTALVKHLEQPRGLHEVIGEVKRNLLAHPNALLGEVGIDRVFRIPKDPRGWSREPDDVSSMESDREQTLGRRKRPLSNLTPSIEHQLIVVKAQLALAIELGRSVSLHSVRAGGALLQLFDELSKEFPSGGPALMSKREEKRLRRNGILADQADEEEAAAVLSKPSFDKINVDLHSCTLSAEMIGQLQKKYPNVFISFSLAINARQRDIRAQLRACDPRRLLIESDWHSAEDLGSRCWTMLRLATDVIGVPLAKEEGGQGQRSVDYHHAASYIHENWLRFVKQSG